MNNAEYLEVIKETFSPDTMSKILYCMVGLAGEAGEIANMAQKSLRGDFSSEYDLSFDGGNCDYGTEWVDHPQRVNLIEEMGGVFYYLHALCWRMDITPEAVMNINAEKLRSRLARGTIRGDGDDR